MSRSGVRPAGIRGPLLTAAMLLLVAVVLPVTAVADVFVTPKHLMIIRAGIDQVFGSYVFAVNNTGEAAAELEATVMLPRETDDFMPQEGVQKEEMELVGEKVTIRKKFEPGINIISIGFRAPARYGDAVLTLRPPAEIKSFSLLVPRVMEMNLQAHWLKEGENGMEADPQYRTFTSPASLQEGASYVLKVEGLPEGRGRLWMMGGMVGFAVFAAAAVLATRTRPRIDDQKSQLLPG